MKKLIASLLFSLGSLYGFSQGQTFESPNYDKIEKEIKDQSSIYFYPKLLQRLIAYDSTLTQVDYHYLYYGYTFQKEYQPYKTSNEEKELIKYYKSSNIENKDYDKIIALATKAINEFPFDLRQLNFLGYIYHLKGDEEMSQKITRRFHGIFGTIMSSGDGQTCESSFHVISVSHEYVFLNYFQFNIRSQSLIKDCDYLALEKNERNIEGIYFNISRLFKNFSH